MGGIVGVRGNKPSESIIFAVPKSTIFSRYASSRSRFSGLRSLQRTVSLRSPRGRESAPVNNTLFVHVIDSIDDLCNVVSGTLDAKRAHLGYLRLDFAIGS